MKKFKKILSVVLAVVMVLAMSAPSFAASGTNADPNTSGSITIEKAIEGQEYNIYKIFDLESYNYTDTSAQYSYKVVSSWEGFIEQYKSYFTLDGAGYLILNAAMDAAAASDFAKAALKHATENNIPSVNVPSENIKFTAAVVDANGEVLVPSKLEYTGLELGYYLIDSTTGTLCALDTTRPSATVEEKNTAPTIEKNIASGSEAVRSVSASYGDTINFIVTVNAYKGAQNYVIHDKMDTDLKFNSDVIVKVNGQALTETKDNVTGVYTVKESGLSDGDTFEIVFSNDYLNGINEATEIEVTYSADLKQSASLYEKNENSVKLTYGDNKEAPGNAVEVFSYDFDVEKVNTDGEHLAGAVFVLSKSENVEDAIRVATYSNADKNDVARTYEVFVGDSDSVIGDDYIEEITTNDSGKFTIMGLKAGTYYLIETKAPAGYNKLTSAQQIVVTNNGSTNTKTIENHTGALLPSTGGIGTTVFYAVGIVLMAGAVFFVIRKKRG